MMNTSLDHTTLQNPFLTPPQVESPQSRSWAMGFAFGFQGPEQSSMTPADIAEDADAFNQGVLAGQDAAINGLLLPQPCVDLNAEGPGAAEFELDGDIEVVAFLKGLASTTKGISHLAGGLAEAVLAVVNLSIALETFSDDPETALQQQAAALQQLLQRLGIQNSMELFTGAGVDLDNRGCELLLTPVFRFQDSATNAAQALGRSRWFVMSWRTDQSGGATIVASSGNF
jgi:hypothetical protein